MAIEKVAIEKFIELAGANPVMDARSPGEFRHAHFPGAYNLALFTDEERKVVGTAYKQQGRQQAIKIGMDYFGLKMRKMVEEAEEITRRLSTNTLLVHCWRGGMRSEAVAWLLDLYGFKIYMLHGGYKKFRQYVLETFSHSLNFKILSGFTGSGKTPLLKELSRSNQPIIDLEEIAGHKGSAFGAIGEPAQPSQEMFENILALHLRKIIADCIWIEDESRRIGLVVVPTKMWQQMQHSPVYFLEVPFETRLLYINEQYGRLEKEKLIEAVSRIQKRLGGLETKMVINYFLEDNILEGFRILLKYYDKCYLKTLNSSRNDTQRYKFFSETIDEKINLGLLLESVNIPTKIL